MLAHRTLPPPPPFLCAVATPDVVAQIKARNQQVLDDAEASFQNSELLRTLKERSEANRAGGWVVSRCWLGGPTCRQTHDALH